MKKSVQIQSAAVLVLVLAGGLITGCGKSGSNLVSPAPAASRTVSYTGMDGDGNLYTLEISEDPGFGLGLAAAYGGGDGDRYVLTIYYKNGGKKESTGRVKTRDHQGKIELTPDTAQNKQIDVTVSDTGVFTELIIPNGAIPEVEAVTLEESDLITFDAWLGHTVSITGTTNYSGDDPLTFTKYDGHIDLADVGLNGSDTDIRVAPGPNGALTLKLGTPSSMPEDRNSMPAVFAYLEPFKEHGASVSVSDPSARVLALNDFHTANGNKRLSQEYVSYMYADRDVDIKAFYAGLIDGEEYFLYWNVSLKQGWNTVISSEDDYVVISAVPDNNYFWAVRSTDGPPEPGH